MVEGGVSDGSIRKRSAFCDVTNVNGKRGLSALSDVTNVHGKRVLTSSLVNSNSKSGIGYGENRENMDLGIAKRVCQGLDKSVKVKSKSEVVEGTKKNELLQLSKSKQLCGSDNAASVGKSPQAKAVPGVPRISHEVKEPTSMSKKDHHSEKGEVVRQELSETGTTTSISMHAGDAQCGKDENSVLNVTDGKCKDDKEMRGVEVVKTTSSVMCDGQCIKDVNFSLNETDEKCKDDKEMIITEVVETTSSVMGDGHCGKDENSLPNVTDGKRKDDKEVSNTEVVKANSSSVHMGDDGQCKKDENSLLNVTDGKCKDDKEASNTEAVKTFVDLDPDTEELTISDVGNDDKGMDDDDVTSNKTSSTVGLEPSQSSNSKFYEPERCTGFNGSGSSNCATGLEMLKTCSCSFCLKAAHIWSDLHYQDTKGRISALKKSRKEVRILVEKSSIPADFAKYCQGNSNKSMKLEFELMDRWRSLFLHTEDILVRESTHLQSSLLTLKDLRDSCKADLEMITGDPSKKK
ncbi:hypothetical protein C5167_017716 [Papaver somniferum]|uniref:Uncharacterized protein n=1 Tax=Papaver somniferum TaxID=3469 RepID=A0A4Y7IKR1_PAPSO|nr:uncharacterized protein LOC113347506 isoform X1 [Papaver somniferum]XP_026446963.1 uncharacterized protein LOC113347506 isoform X1 [Papaver somniferum]XP_026446964.1 uncharacterized protein LOC113347506 isoform X1 [Papaver somniferum]RZC49297.1 hypothetical protein C5167_017716 [Papaver somniferum]